MQFNPTCRDAQCGWTNRDSRGYVYIDQDSGSTYNDSSYAVLHEEALLVL
jgi:hypothetical protein